MAYDDRTNLVTQPLLEPGSKRDPKSGPAYDSITSSDSSFSRRDVSLSHVQPGQAIALPDGSVLPVGGGETTDYRANMATGATACGTYPQQDLPSKHGATPGPAPSQAHQQQGLPSKHGATPGPAPGMTYPQQFPPGATPGPPPHVKGSEGSGPAPQYTGPQMQHQYPHAMASNDRQPQYQPNSYNYNQQQHYRYPPPQPHQQPYRARGPAQPLAPFSPAQYQPYQGHPPVQILGQGAAVQYYPYQGAITNQPKPRPPVKTSFKFDTRTLGDNHFYMAICLLVTVIVCVNLLGILCAIPALIFASIAADANAKDNYEQALKYHRKARFCNIGAGVAIVTSFIYYIGIIIAIISATN